MPVSEPFGQVIKTVAQIKANPSDERMISAKTNGVVRFLNENFVEGKTVTAGTALFSVSGNQLATNNSSVLFTEAQNNYETAKMEYERKKELAKDKIVSERDLLESQNKFENAKAVYENLERNFNNEGELVKSPVNGYISQVFVENGKYIEQGQPLVRIAQNKKLLLHAEVQPKYEPLLKNFSDAVIQTMESKQAYTLKELDGKMLSYGKSTWGDNFLIPVHLEMNKSEEFIPGEFVNLYLKTSSTENKLTVPNSALLEEQGYYFVYVQKTPELFEKREVKIGNSDGLRTEIVSGISPDERIVSRGAMFIKLSQATGALDPHAGHVH